MTEDQLLAAIDQTMIVKQSEKARARDRLRKAHERLTHCADDVQRMERMLHLARMEVIAAEDAVNSLS